MEYDERHAIISKECISVKDLFSVFSGYDNSKEVILLTAEIFDDMKG